MLQRISLLLSSLLAIESPSTAKERDCGLESYTIRSFFEILVTTKFTYVKLRISKNNYCNVAVEENVLRHHLKVEMIVEIFAFICFQGAALLRMVQGFMKDELEQGVINYLNKYRYSNAQTDDLWMSLSLVSGKISFLETIYRLFSWSVVTVSNA